jgi:hypothetical protein
VYDTRYTRILAFDFLLHNWDAMAFGARLNLYTVVYHAMEALV